MADKQTGMEEEYMVNYKLNKTTILRFQQHEVRTRKMLLRLFSEAMSDRFDMWLPQLKYGAKPGLRSTSTSDLPYLPLKLVARYVATSDRLYKEKVKN